MTRAGCRVTVLSNPRAHITKSRFVANVIAVDGGVDAIINALRITLQERQFDHVIVGDDVLFAALAALPDRSWLENWFPVDPSNEAVLKFITSKHEFLCVGSEAGLPIAPYVMCSTVSEAREAAHRFGYPVVLKNSFGSSGGAVHRVDGDDELVSYFARYAEAERLAIQQFIRGRVACIEILFDRGKVRCFYGSYKVDCYPHSFGPASFKQPFVHPAFGALAERVGRLTGFNGPASIDVMIEETTGSVYILEMNPRPTGGNFSLTRRIERAFRAEYRRFLQGEPTSPTDIGYFDIARPIFPTSLYYFFGVADKRSLTAWFRGAQALFEAPWDDFRLTFSFLCVTFSWAIGTTRMGKMLKLLLRRSRIFAASR